MNSPNLKKEVNNGLKKIKDIFITRDFMFFLIIGVVNTLNGVLFSYVYSLFLNTNIAFVVGYITSLSISYLLNSYITFKESLNFIKFIKFCISYIPNFIIQNLIVLIVFNWLGYHKIFAFLLAAIVGVPITFLLMKFFAFNRKTEIQPH
ncbi:MAG: GtrA family protein [Clostridiales bacterium]